MSHSETYDKEIRRVNEAYEALMEAQQTYHEAVRDTWNRGVPVTIPLSFDQEVVLFAQAIREINHKYRGARHGVLRSNL